MYMTRDWGCGGGRGRGCGGGRVVVVVGVLSSSTWLNTSESV